MRGAIVGRMDSISAGFSARHLSLRGGVTALRHPPVEGAGVLQDLGRRREADRVEERADLLDRSVHEVLVAHLDPPVDAQAVARLEQRLVGGDPLERTDLGEGVSLRVRLPPPRHEELPRVPVVPLDGQRPGHDHAREHVPGGPPPGEQRGDRRPPVALDEDEPRIREQLVEVRHPKAVARGLVEVAAAPRGDAIDLPVQHPALVGREVRGVEGVGPARRREVVVHLPQEVALGLQRGELWGAAEHLEHQRRPRPRAAQDDDGLPRRRLPRENRSGRPQDHAGHVPPLARAGGPAQQSSGQWLAHGGRLVKASNDGGRRVDPGNERGS